MEDSGEELTECKQGLNIEELAGMLSSDTLKALQEHLNSKNNRHDQDGHDIDSDHEPHVNADYKLKSYWNERFQEEENFEWLLNYQQLKLHLAPILPKGYKTALIVGCGNSTFSADLYDDDVFKEITNIDFSEIVIAKMSEQHALARPNMKWITMDMLDLKFESESFDVVIDKATMDALMVDERDVWNPSDSVIESVDTMCRGISRVLKPGGIFLQISFAQPHFRTKYLMNVWKSKTDCAPTAVTVGHCNEYEWTLSCQPIALETGCLDYFMYTMIKDVKN